MPDINVNALAEAINDKMDRDGKNVDTTSGADNVIAYQVPTAENNYRWYRLYASGWIEQGGKDYFTVAAYTDFNLVIPMADANYSVQAVYYDSTASATSVYGINIGSLTNTSFKAKMGTTGNNTYFFWEAKGIAAGINQESSSNTSSSTESNSSNSGSGGGTPDPTNPGSGTTK